MWGSVVVVAVALAGGVVFFGSRGLRRLFSDEHFVEIARAAEGIKGAAMGHPITPGELPRPGDPRMLLTSAGLAIVYTVHVGDGGVTHHCSISVPGSITTHAVGALFTAYFVGLVGLPIEKMRFQWGRSTIHHAEASLTPEEHEALSLLRVPMVSRASVAEFRRAAMEVKNRTSWAREEYAPPPGS